MLKSFFILSLLLFPLSANAQTLSGFFGGRLPSLKVRSVFAQEAGIKGYKGTAPQNVKLLSYLKKAQKAQKGSELILGAVSGGEGNYTPVTGYISRTTQFVSAAATTIPVVSTLDKSGRQIALSNISASVTVKVYMNLEPGTAKEEPLMCTGLTATSWTGCTRGLPFQSGSEVTSTTITTSHNAGASLIITNISQFYNQFVSVDGTQSINDVKTFTSLPFFPTSTPTDPRQAITLFQFQQATTTGGINASLLAKGVVQEAATSSYSDTGSTGARNFVNPAHSVTTSLGAASADYFVRLRASDGSLDSSLGGTANGLAQLNASSKVIQNPANATTTPTSGQPVNYNSNLSITVSSTPTAAGDATSKTYVDSQILGASFSKLIVATTTDVTFDTTNAEQMILATTTIAANTLSTGNVIRIHLNMTAVSFAATTAQLTLKLKYGSQEIISNTINNGIGATEAFSATLDFELYAAGTTSTQEGAMVLIGLKGNGIQDANDSVANVAYIRRFAVGTGTVDGTAAQPLSVTAKFNNAAAVSSMTISNSYVEIVR